MLSINNLNKNFATDPILKSLTLTIQEKTIVGLGGVSGSGKSTLLRCIQQLETVDSGTISLGGTCGFMFQDFQLFPHMTVYKNILYPTQFQKSKENIIEYAENLLKTLGIYEKKNNFPHELSGGQKQRAALARSLIMSPQILLCDEPTSGLDIGSIDEIILLLKSIRELGVTMIIASHDLNFLTKISDRIIILKQGELVLDVNPHTLENPISVLAQYY